MIPMLLLGLWGPLGWSLLEAWAQAPGTSFSHPHGSRLSGDWREETKKTDRDPILRNWCPYQEYKLVTFVAACKTEKYLVHSQQPCPQGAPDCQNVKVMYRMAQKPVYQIKQRVMASINWRCCPGFSGPDCQHHDPVAIPESTDLGDDLLESWDRPVSLEPAHQAVEIDNSAGEELQSDTHPAVDSPPGPWKALASNLTAAMTVMEANQTESEFPDEDKGQMLLLQMDTFLKAHLSPIWWSFNQSLHNLSQAIRNLSLDVEANRQAIRKVQESTVARDDLQELGAKFETKVQENAQKVGQLQQDLEDRLDAQRLSLQHSLNQVQADVDTKFKKFLKAHERNDSLLVAAVGTAARPEPESLQARLGQLQRNLSALHAAAGHREEELSSALADMKATLTQHENEIKELYSESDETFDQISKVEELVRNLQVNHTALRELRIILMEKSLIMEENKEELERQLLELNLTLQQLQGAQADLLKYIKDCNCHKLSVNLDAIREDQQGATTRALEDAQESLDGSSPQALGGRVDALSAALDVLAAEGEQARAERARLRTQLRALRRDTDALQAAEPEVRAEVRGLHGSFSALLADALRHEAVLAALFGEELLEALTEPAADQLPLTYEQIRQGLRDAAAGLQEQALGWDALAARVTALERGAGQSSTGAQAWPPLPSARLEPSHDATPEEAGGPELAELARELRRLSADVELAGQCCGAAARNSSLELLRGALAIHQRSLEQHQQLFHSLFRNFEGLVLANISLDLGKLQAMLDRKAKKQQKDLEAPKKRDKKQVEPLADAHGKGLEPDTLRAQLWETGSPVAFYASFSEEMADLQTLKFNTTHLNIGSSYFPENGYFRAPERGVYLFAVSIEFGPGPGTGQLVFGGHHRTPICTTEGQQGGSTVTTFAMAELQKGERVWFELTQGSVRKRSPSGTAFGGFLIFKT